MKLRVPGQWQSQTPPATQRVHRGCIHLCYCTQQPGIGMYSGHLRVSAFILDQRPHSTVRMEIEKDHFSKRIMNLTLEILYLLTGEDFVVVRTSNELFTCRISPSLSDASGIDQDPITSSPNTQSSEKILNLSNKLIHLLTGEIRRFVEGDDLQTSSERCMEEAQDEFSDGNTADFSPEDDMSSPEDINQAESMKLVIMPQTERRDAYVKIKEEDLPHNISSESEEHKQQYSNAISSPSSPVSAEGEMYVCSLCGKCFKLKGMASHLKDDNGENLCLCSGCETPLSFDPQVAAPPGSEENSFDCLKCEMSFANKTVFLAHESTHTGNKSFQCAECGLTFSNQSILETHQSIHTGEKPFSCSDCGKCFAMKANLVKHVKIHNGEKPFTCLDCGKCFGMKSNLVKHQRIHTGEKPFSCAECGKSFGMKSNLIKHQRVHTGEKPFPCQQCGRCFASRSNLVNHERTHTGEKPFTCSYCGRGFITSSDLFRHQKTHTETKQYMCTECGECFISKSNLVVHQKTHLGQNLL